MKIGELARATNASVETIRFYERERLLNLPERSQGNYRIYDATHVSRLSFIRNCRSLDMTLEEIGVLLRFKDAPTGNCQKVNDLLDAHIGHVSSRIDELRSLEAQLKALRSQCDRPQAGSECGILHELSDTTRTPVLFEPQGHVPGPHAKSHGRKKT